MNFVSFKDPKLIFWVFNKEFGNHHSSAWWSHDLLKATVYDSIGHKLAFKVLKFQVFERNGDFYVVL